MSSSISAASGTPSVAALAAGLIVSVPPEYNAFSPLSDAPEEVLTLGVSGAAIENLSPAELAAVDAYGDAQWAAAGPALTVTKYEGQTNLPGFSEKLETGSIWSQVPAGAPITGDTAATIIDTGTTVETFVGTITAAESAAWLAGNVSPGVGPGVTDTPTVSDVAPIAGGAAWLTVIFAPNAPHTLKANVVTDTNNADGTVTPVTTQVDIEIDGGAQAAAAAAQARPAAPDPIQAELDAVPVPASAKPPKIATPDMHSRGSRWASQAPAFR